MVKAARKQPTANALFILWWKHTYTYAIVRVCECIGVQPAHGNCLALPAAPATASTSTSGRQRKPMWVKPNRTANQLSKQPNSYQVKATMHTNAPIQLHAHINLQSLLCRFLHGNWNTSWLCHDVAATSMHGCCCCCSCCCYALAFVVLSVLGECADMDTFAGFIQKRKVIQ